MTEGEGQEPAAGAGTTGSDAFISYASQDAAVAQALVGALEQERITCWIAPRDVRPGALYADAIVRAIGAARTVVLVLSGNSIASSHVGKEIERASSKQRPIIALRIDTAPLTPALEYFLSESQWVDAPQGNLDKAYKRLINAIRAPADKPAGLPGTAQSLATGSGRQRLLLIAAIAAIGIGLAALLVTRMWPGRAVTADKALAPAAIVTTDKSVAVLPFTDMSEKKDQEYFADGIAEEVLDRLARIPGLRVVGRASSFQFKDKGADSAGVGTALGVSFLLEGSVRRDAGRVRVTAQLVEARNGLQRWADHFDADVVDVLQVQDTIATKIARALQITVESSAISRPSIKSAQALDAYLRGLHAADRSSEEGLNAALVDFKQALTLDPTFAPAATELAKAYAFIGSEGWMPPRTAFEQARVAAMRALQLDAKSPAPHVVLAHIHTIYDWDWPGAEQEVKLAFALGPRNFDSVNGAMVLATARGQWDEAQQLAAEAIEIDPLNPDVRVLLGWTVYMRMGKYAEAEQSVRRGLQIAPTWGAGQYILGEALMLQGHNEAALVEFGKEALEDGQLEGSAMAEFAAGRKGKSDALLAEAIRRNGAAWPSEIARVYAFRGDKDHAFEWLDRAFEYRDEDLYLIKDDPLLKNLGGDPRLKAFLKKMNLLD